MFGVNNMNNPGYEADTDKKATNQQNSAKSSFASLFGVGAGAGGKKSAIGRQPVETPPTSPDSRAVSIFGMSLSLALSRSNKVLKRSDRLPKIAIECMAFIESNGIDELGIYRLSGSTKEINLFRTSYDNFMSVDFYIQRYTDPNAVASLFKAYVRELPECLLGDRLVNNFQDLFIPYNDLDTHFKDSITLEDDDGHVLLNNEDLLVSLERLIKLLPEDNRVFLAVFFGHLRRISLKASVNKMGLNNLQVVWSPTLRFGGALFMILVLQHKRLFPVNVAPDASPLTPPKFETSSISSDYSSSSTGPPEPTSAVRTPKRAEGIDGRKFKKQQSIHSNIIIPVRRSSNTPSPLFPKRPPTLDQIVTTNVCDSKVNDPFVLPEIDPVSTSPLLDFSYFEILE